MNNCEYCCGDVNSRSFLLSNGNEAVYIDGNGNLSADDELELEDKRINYCPMCGRDLTKENCEECYNYNIGDGIDDISKCEGCKYK